MICVLDPPAVKYGATKRKADTTVKEYIEKSQYFERHCRVARHDTMVYGHVVLRSVFFLYLLLLGSLHGKPNCFSGYGNVQRCHGDGYFIISEDQNPVEEQFLFKNSRTGPSDTFAMQI